MAQHVCITCNKKIPSRLAGDHKKERGHDVTSIFSMTAFGQAIRHIVFLSLITQIVVILCSPLGSHRGYMSRENRRLINSTRNSVINGGSYVTLGSTVYVISTYILKLHATSMS